jgi:hypothetical protein
MSKSGGITILKFKLYYRSIVINNSMVLAQSRHEFQWNRIKDIDKNLYSSAHLIFDKGTKNIQQRKDSLFNKCQEN